MRGSEDAVVAEHNRIALAELTRMIAKHQQALIREGESMATIGHIIAAKAAMGELPSPLPAVRVVDKLGNGGVAVIIGVKGDNVTDAMRNHPQVHCWDTTDQKTHGKSLPANTRAVMITRFVTHALEKRIRDEAKRRGIFIMPGLVTTGDVRDQLQLVLDRPSLLAPPPPPEPPAKPVAAFNVAKESLKAAYIMAEPKVVVEPPKVVEPEKESPVIPKLRGVEHGELRKFVTEHADRRVVAVAPIDESKRLWKLFRERGVETSLNSMRQAVWRYVEVPMREPAVRPVSAMVDMHRATSKTVVARAEKVVERKIVQAVDPQSLVVVEQEAPRPRPKPSSSDNLSATVGEVKAALALLNELLPTLEKEVEKFREQQRRARELFQLDT